jgi:hypothetical protein
MAAAAAPSFSCWLVCLPERERPRARGVAAFRARLLGEAHVPTAGQPGKTSV